MVSEKAKEKYILGNVESAYGTTLIAVVNDSRIFGLVYILEMESVLFLNCDENFAQTYPLLIQRCFFECYDLYL